MSLNRKEADGSTTQVAGIPFVTKENIGLSKVENKSSEEIRDEITSKNIKDALGYTPANEMSDSATLDVELVRYKGYKHYYMYSDDLSNNTVYASYQGLCETNHSTFIAMIIPIEYKNNYINITDKAIIVEYDKQFNEIRRSGEIKLYHGSNLWYNNGKIYVTASTHGTTGVNKIVVVDYNTLSVDKEITTGITPVFVFFKGSSAYVGNLVEVYKYDLNFENYEIISFPQSYSRLHDIRPYKNGYIASLNYPNAIALMDDNFNIIKQYSLNNDMFTTGELKGIAIDGDNIFIAYNDRTYTRYEDAEFSEVYATVVKINFDNNVTPYRKESTHEDSQHYAWVSTESTAVVQDGSNAKPYATIMQALKNGYTAVHLVESDGCIITGNVRCYIDSRNSENLIYFGILNNAYISGSNVIVDTWGKDNSFRGCTVMLPNSDVRTLLNTYYSNVFIDDLTKLSEKTINLIPYPTSNPSFGTQKYTISASSNKINTSFDNLSGRGSYIINFAFKIDGNTFSVNISATSSGYINQYFHAVSRYGNKNHVLTGYVSFTMENKQITGVLLNTELDGEAITPPTLTRIAITHLI